MGVFWHDYVSHYYELVSDAHFLQYRENKIAAIWSQKRLPFVTIEGDEMQRIRLIVTLQGPGHAGKVLQLRLIRL